MLHILKDRTRGAPDVSRKILLMLFIVSNTQSVELTADAFVSIYRDTGSVIIKAEQGQKVG